MYTTPFGHRNSNNLSGLAFLGLTMIKHSDNGLLKSFTQSFLLVAHEYSRMIKQNKNILENI